jgi:hypothetical protein
MASISIVSGHYFRPVRPSGSVAFSAVSCCYFLLLFGRISAEFLLDFRWIFFDFQGESRLPGDPRALVFLSSFQARNSITADLQNPLFSTLNCTYKSLK